MLIALPQRHAFPTRDDFAVAVTDKFAELAVTYEALPILSAVPEWALVDPGRKTFHIALPLSVAREGGEEHGLAGLIKHMIERGKSIGRMAHVEQGDRWMVWIEAE